MAKDGDIRFEISADDKASAAFEQFQSKLQASISQTVQSFGSAVSEIDDEMKAFGGGVDALFSLLANPTPWGLFQSALTLAGQILAIRAADAKILADELERVTEAAEEMQEAWEKGLDASYDRSEREHTKAKKMGWDEEVMRLPEDQRDLARYKIDRAIDLEDQLRTLQKAYEEKMAGETAFEKTNTEEEWNDAANAARDMARLDIERVTSVIAARHERERELEAMKQMAELSNAMFKSDDARAGALAQSGKSAQQILDETLKEIERLNQLDLFETPELYEGAKSKARKEYEDATKKPNIKRNDNDSTANLYESRNVTRGAADTFDAARIGKLQLDELSEIKRSHLQAVRIAEDIMRRSILGGHKNITAPAL